MIAESCLSVLTLVFSSLLAAFPTKRHTEHYKVYCSRHTENCWAKTIRTMLYKHPVQQWHLLLKILISFDISATSVISGIFDSYWSIFITMTIFATLCHLGHYWSLFVTSGHYSTLLAIFIFCYFWSFWTWMNTLGTIHHYWTLLVILDI